MAGLGAKLWLSADSVTAANLNGYIQDQTVMRFATTTARDAAFGGVNQPVLAEGMVCYVDTESTIYYYSGAGWATLSEDDQMVLGVQIFS